MCRFTPGVVFLDVNYSICNLLLHTYAKLFHIPLFPFQIVVNYTSRNWKQIFRVKYTLVLRSSFCFTLVLDVSIYSIWTLKYLPCVTLVQSWTEIQLSVKIVHVQRICGHCKAKIAILMVNWLKNRVNVLFYCKCISSIKNKTYKHSDTDSYKNPYNNFCNLHYIDSRNTNYL